MVKHYRSSSRDSTTCGKRGKKRDREITEDEIQEYLSRKAQMKALLVAKKLKASVISGYSNDSNPFGDANLGEKFVWRKKIERDVGRGVLLDAFSVKAEKMRQSKRMAEIEKVKRRRVERAVQKAQYEEERAMLARERARAEFQNWGQKEDEFHFEQSKVRSEIRLREGRAKAIDILSKNLNCSDDFEVQIDEPYTIFKGLTVKEMDELQIDIRMHLDLDRATPTHIQFWEAMMVICDWELTVARKRDARDRARARGEEPPIDVLAEERGFHSSVEADVKDLLDGKSLRALETMQSHIELQMRTGTAKNVEYWEAILKRFQIYKAKACLKEIHLRLLRKHLKRLEQPAENQKSSKENEDLRSVEEEWPCSPEPMVQEEEQAGSFSPEPYRGNEDMDAMDPDEDQAELNQKRAVVLIEQQRRTKEGLAVEPWQLDLPQGMGAFAQERLQVYL